MSTPQSPGDAGSVRPADVVDAGRSERVDTPPVRRPDQSGEHISLTPFVWRLIGALVAAVIIGVAAGLVWHALVDLPVYSVGPDGGAATTERGLANVFGVDATYSAIGAVVGLLIGLASWRLFGHRGWIVTLIAIGAAVVAALVCWGVGVAQGPSDFAARIAAASNGEQVPIDFALHTRAAIYIWPLFAVGTVMFASAFGRERTSGW